MCLHVLSEGAWVCVALCTSWNLTSIRFLNEKEKEKSELWLNCKGALVQEALKGGGSDELQVKSESILSM